MCLDPVSLTTIAAISGVAGAGMGAVGMISQGMAAKNAADARAEMAQRAADDAYERGEEASQDKRLQVARMRDRQKVAMAANGGDATFGSNADLIADTELLGERDAFRIRESGRRQADGFDFEAAQAKAEGRAAMTNSIIGAAGSLLTSASSVSSRWAKWQSPAPSRPTPTGPFAPQAGLY